MDIGKPPAGNELQPRSDQSADLVKSDLMQVLMRKLETTLPEEYPGQPRMDWEDESISWSHTPEGRLLNLAIFLSSNNLMSRECDRFYDWLIDTLPTSLLVTLTSSKLLSTDACVVQLFRHALATQKADFARMLLDKRSDLHLILKSSSFFVAALEKNDILNLKFLLEVKTRYNIDYDLPLYAARSREAVMLLLDAGVDVNMQYELPYSYFGFDSFFLAKRLLATALYCAVKSRYLDVFMALVEREADVNIVAKPIFDSNEWSDLEGSGVTPLQQAIYDNDEAGEASYAMVTGLLRAGADVNAISLNLEWIDTGIRKILMGTTSPLETACRHGQKPWVELLVQLGAEIEQQNLNGETVLELAIRSGKVDIVRILLEKVGTPTGSSLMVAVEEEHFEIVKALIEAGADCSTTVTNEFGLSIAQVAQTISDQPWILETLVEAGALRPSLPPTQAEKRAQVRRAIEKNDANAVRKVLESGMDTTQDKEDWVDLLCSSIESQEKEITRVLLEAGVDANTSCPWLYYEGRHCPATPLSWALTFEPSKDTISWILDAGGDPDANMWQEEIQSPIHFVVCCIRHSDFPLWVMESILELLLIKGASVDAPGRLPRTEDVIVEYGYAFAMRTPLQEAFILGRDPLYHDDPFVLIQRLLAVGANINYPALENGGTALQIAVGEAARTGNLKMVEFLLERGADVNAAPASSGGRTALQFAAAAEQGNLILVERLLHAGADINAPAAEDKGITALQGAAIRGHLKFSHIFLDGGANVNAPGSAIDGRTALEGAAENGRLDMVQLLMNVGADSHLPGRKRYRTAEQFALKEGHLAVVKLLRSRCED
jgi:ankyrin repeat protein